MTAGDLQVGLVLAAIAGIVGVLWGLGLVLDRERVKADLRSRGCQPIRIRWSYWGSLDGDGGWSTFRVCYRDPVGREHEARCRTSWPRRRVIWSDPEP